MDDCEPPWSLARFGEFEVNRKSGVLKKRGLRVKLQEQPFRILTRLLDSRGEIVTRDELRQMLWPDGTNVDFEHSLNAAVAKLRQALGDSAETPRFIETLSRRGYRFTGSVERVSPPTSALPNAATSPEALAEPLPGAAGEMAPVPLHAVNSRKPGRPWAVASVLGLCAAALIATWRRSPVTIKTGGLPVPLTSYAGSESHPAFSPDGTQVAFVWDGPEENNADIYVKVAGSEEPLRLTTDPARDDVPAWSPDGRWIAFVRITSADSRGDVLVVPALGGVERKVGETVFGDRYSGPNLAWTSDSKWLAVRDNSRSIPGLYLISVETGEMRLLLERPVKKGDRGEAFSADGRRLAFCRSGSLYVVELEGLKPKGAPRRLTHEANTVVGSPAWSPNQQDIIFQRHGSAGRATLWRVRADGSQLPSPIPDTGTSAFDPAVSRTGRLAYAQGIYDANIWRLPLRGAGVSAGPPVRLIASSRFDGSMALSADGRHVAFTSTRTGSEQIWVADSDGSRPVQLTYYSEGFAGSPRWSPDGKLIAYDAVFNDQKDIYIVPASGGSSTKFTHIGDNWLPSWSADGKWIYFSSERDGRRDIWKKAFAGGDELRVTRNGGVAARESPDGKYLSYFSVEGGSLWLMPLSGGIFDERDKRLVADRANMLAFDVSNTGVYFGVWVSFGEQGDRKDRQTKTLNFHDFATGRTRMIAAISKPLSIGLSVSRDERWLLFSQVDRAGIDLMLVDGFQ